MSVAGKIKNLIVPTGRKPRIVMAGPFRGLRLNLDLRVQSQVYTGLFEREVYSGLTSLSQGIRCAVDIGAADGEFTLFFLMKTAAERVITFEPDPRMQECLMGNMRLNAMESNGRWMLSRKYLGSSGGPDHTTPAWLASQVLTPCMIKMDIDGGEGEVLESAAPLLSMPDVRWLIETHSLTLENDCIAILKSSGYTVRIVKNAWWRSIIPEQRPIPHNRWLIATKMAATK
jgi:hypothetical protein